MNFFTGLVIGLIAGWVIEWFVDWRFWRRDDKQDPEQLATAQERIRELQQKIERLEGELTASEAKIDELEADLVAMRAQAHETRKVKDNLDRISGIGPAFAKRLNDAGVNTFAELAALPPERVRDIIAPQEWQKIEPESWIAQADRLAREDNDIRGNGS